MRSGRWTPARTSPCRGGKKCCWLRITDEYTGAILWTRVFEPARWERVEVSAVQAELRLVWALWGLPDWLRVDNGYPWGGRNDLPPGLVLWVLGMAVGVHWNDPACPQQNGKVERSQGVSERWVESHTCADIGALQRRLDDNDRIQREVYPSCAGRSRLAAHPSLLHSGRPYDADGEQQRWSLQAVWDYLGGLLLRRKVDSGGKVALYRRNYTVGRRYAGQDVWVCLDELTGEWVFATEQGTVDRQPARELTWDNIINLTVARPSRPSRP